MSSPAEQLAALSPEDRAEWLADLTPDEAEALQWAWRFWARPEQISPWSPLRGERERRAALEAIRFWVIVSGRGFGKNRAASQTLIEEAKTGGEGFRMRLIGRTRADPRDTIIEGAGSGILACSPPDFMPRFEPSKRKLTWPNGAVAHTFTAEEPEALRGSQSHLDYFDEAAAYDRLRETWDMAMLGLRLGEHPRAIVTTTPKPRGIIRELLKDPAARVTRGSTYANRSNLPASYLADLERRYKGTRIERQEIHGELLDETPGAMWTRALVDATRVLEAPELTRIVVGVDPSVADPTKSEDPCECGIVVAGQGADGHGYVLADLSGVMSPGQWAKRAAGAFSEWGANSIVAEGNNGGELVRLVIAAENDAIPIRIVHAAVGKTARAEPIAHRFEQHRAHIVGTLLGELEDQLCSWLPGTKSPDRLDAMVWALTELGDGQADGPMRIDNSRLARVSPIYGDDRRRNR